MSSDPDLCVPAQELSDLASACTAWSTALGQVMPGVKAIAGDAAIAQASGLGVDVSGFEAAIAVVEGSSGLGALSDQLSADAGRLDLTAEQYTLADLAARDHISRTTLQSIAATGAVPAGTPDAARINQILHRDGSAPGTQVAAGALALLYPTATQTLPVRPEDPLPVVPAALRPSASRSGAHAVAGGGAVSGGAVGRGAVGGGDGSGIVTTSVVTHDAGAGSGTGAGPGHTAFDGGAFSTGVPVSAGASGAAAPGSVSGWISQAVSILEAQGIPASRLDPNAIAQIIQHESGGNPAAVNLWDSNAAAGHPSEGLMQTIAPTFNQYKLPGHDNIFNPVDNIIAGVRYAISRYGSVSNVPGVVRLNEGLSYVGF